MDKVQKIREEVEKLKSNLVYGACSSQTAMETHCKEEAYNEVLAILDTMQEEPTIQKIVDEHFWEMLDEEPVSEELEEAASRYAKEEYSRKSPATLPDRCRGCYSPLMYAFKAGAKWGKNQAMAEIQAQSMALAHGCPKEAVEKFKSEFTNAKQKENNDNK